jgi:hypothetical protein
MLVINSQLSQSMTTVFLLLATKSDKPEGSGAFALLASATRAKK